MDQTNILIITDLLTAGGATTYLVGLLSELSKKHHIDLILFHEQTLKFSHQLPRNNNIAYYNISLKHSFNLRSLPQRLFTLLPQLIKLKSKKKYHLVLTDLIYPTLTYILINKLINFSKAKLLHHIHGSLYLEKKSEGSSLIYRKFLFLIEYFTLSCCQKVITGSQYSYNQIVKLYDLSSTKIFTSKLGIDPTLPHSIRRISQLKARQKLGLSPNRKYILLTSRIEPRKGVQEFIKYFPKPNKLPNNYTIIICSQFCSSPWLYSFFQNLDASKLGSKVLLVNTPSRTELALFYKSANVTVLPSVDLETFGFTSLESFYYKTPVVAFNVGANPELIPKNFLVKYQTPKDFKKLYQKAIYFLKNDPKIDYSQFNFSWKNYVANLLATTNDNPQHTPHP